MSFSNKNLKKNNKSQFSNNRNEIKPKDEFEAEFDEEKTNDMIGEIEGALKRNLLSVSITTKKILYLFHFSLVLSKTLK